MDSTPAMAQNVSAGNHGPGTQNVMAGQGSQNINSGNGRQFNNYNIYECTQYPPN